MSIMWPPHRVKMVSIPSAFSALATRWPPEMVSGCWAWSTSTGVLSVSPTSGAIFAIILLLGRLHDAPTLSNALMRRPALLQRLDDVHVVDDRARHARVVADGAAPDRAHVDQERISRLAQ